MESGVPSVSVALIKYHHQDLFNDVEMHASAVANDPLKMAESEVNIQEDAQADMNIQKECMQALYHQIEGLSVSKYHSKIWILILKL